MNDLDQEVFINGITALNLYGDATEQVAEAMQRWAGTTQDVADATKDLISTMTQLGNNQYYRELYLSGDRSVETIQAIAQMTGLSEEVVINNSDLTTSMLGVVASGELDMLGTMMSGMDVYLSDPAIQAALQRGGTRDADGRYNLSDSIDILSSDDLANNHNAQMLLQLLPLLEMFTNGDVMVTVETRQVAIKKAEAPAASNDETPAESGTTEQTGATPPQDAEQTEATPPQGADQTVTPAEGAAPTPVAPTETEYETRTFYTINRPAGIRAVQPLEYDKVLAGVVYSDRGFGANTMSPGGRVKLGQQMQALVAGGHFSAFMSNSSLATRQTYAGLYENAPEYMKLADIVDQMPGDYTLEQLQDLDPDNPAYQAIDARLRSMGYSAEYALEVMASLNEEMLIGGLRASGAYGDAIDDVAARIEQLTGSIKEQNEVYANFIALMESKSDVDSLWALYSAGSRDANVVSQLATSLNISEDILYGDYTAATAAYNRYKEGYQYDLEVGVGAYGSTIITKELIDYLIEQGVDLTGSMSWTDLKDRATEAGIDVTGEGWSAIDQAVASGQTVTVQFAASTTTVKVPTSSSPSQTDDNTPQAMMIGADGETIPVEQPAFTEESVTTYTPEVSVTANTANTITPNDFNSWFAIGTSKADKYTSTTLTPLHKHRGAMMMLHKAEQGTLATDYLGSSDITKQTLAGISENSGMFLYMATGLQGWNTDHQDRQVNLMDLATMTPDSEGYLDMVAAVESLGLSFPQAQQYAKDFIDETENGIYSLIKVFGDLTDEILEGSKQWQGTDRDRFGAAKEMVTAVDDYAEFNYYRGLYNNAANKAELPNFVVEKIAGYTNLTADEIRAGGANVDYMLGLAAASYGEEATVQMSEMGQYLEDNPALMSYIASTSGGLKDGSYTFKPTAASIAYMQTGLGGNVPKEFVAAMS